MGKGEEGIHMQLTAKQGGGAKFGARRGRKVVGFQIALSTTATGYHRTEGDGSKRRRRGNALREENYCNFHFPLTTSLARP